MRLDVVTIFPEYLEPLNVSLVGKARARGVLDVHVHDLRQWTYDRHNTVDDTPYGGGPGMVMKTEPWGEALDESLADGYEAGHTPRSSSCPRPAACCSPRSWPSNSPPSPGCSSPRPGTRASTAG
ncbi:tRNA (guanine-N(1)-)-methyltransferase [Streptomyces badius]